MCIAILNPLPCLPRRLSLGIRQSEKISSYVDEPQIPILFSFVPNVKPGVPFSTMKAEISFIVLPRFSTVPVTAITIYTSASLPFVMKHLDPLRTHSSPSRTAFVCCPCASVPAPGSVRPKAPSFFPDARSGTYFCFCSSVPNVSIGSTQSDVCADTITPVVPQTLESSSTHITYVRMSQPCPPYSFGTGMPRKPYFAILSTVSLGNLCCSSISCARGFASFSAKLLKRFLAISCFLLSEKSMNIFLRLS